MQQSLVHSVPSLGVASLLGVLSSRKKVVQSLIHAGQHYDANMSDVFSQHPDIPARAGS